MKDHIYAVAERMRLLLSKLGQLDSSLAKFLILRASFGACRINHLLRALPFAVGRALSVDTGRLFKLVFVDCVGNGCDPSHFDFACLPPFSGGLGLRDPERVHEAAFLAFVFTYSAGTEHTPMFLDGSDRCMGIHAYLIWVPPVTRQRAPRRCTESRVV